MNLRLVHFPERGIALTGATSYLARSISSAVGSSPVSISRIEELPSNTILIHLAASIQGANVLETNFELDRFVVEKAADKVAGLIYASGNNVYDLGLNKRIENLGPTLQLYGASKLVGEALVRSLFPRSWAILRIADVFGFGQRHGNFFRAVEASIKTESPLKLFGMGGKVRSYIYAPEFASIALHFAKILQGEDIVRVISNVCHPQSASVLEIINSISAYAKLPVEKVAIEKDESGNDIRTMIPGPFLGYEERWSLDQALAHYVVQCTTAKDR